MITSTLSTFLVCIFVLAAATDGDYQVFTKQQLIDRYPLYDPNFQAHAAINSAYREDCNTSIIPPDDGSASYGDLIYSKPRKLDTALHKEVFVNYDVSSEEYIVFWSRMFHRECVSHVRVLNFGRERAFAKSINVEYQGSQGEKVDIILLIPANKEIRMIIEAYGYDMYAPEYCNKYSDFVGTTNWNSK